MKNNVENKKPDAGESAKRWWQWLLLYPGLGIAMLGAVPTYLEAYRSYNLGVAFGGSYNANEQNRLWQENFACAQKANFSATTNKKKVEIGSVVCDSGDVLLRAKRPEWDQPQLRWVSWTEVASGQSGSKSTQALLDVFKSANASETPPLILAQAPAPTVLCQRWVGPGQLLQRIGTATGCVDQVINTYNGLVISSRPAPCNPNC